LRGRTMVEEKSLKSSQTSQGLAASGDRTGHHITT